MYARIVEGLTLESELCPNVNPFEVLICYELDTT